MARSRLRIASLVAAVAASGTVLLAIALAVAWQAAPHPWYQEDREGVLPEVALFWALVAFPDLAFTASAATAWWAAQGPAGGWRAKVLAVVTSLLALFAWWFTYIALTRPLFE